MAPRNRANLSLDANHRVPNLSAVCTLPVPCLGDVCNDDLLMRRELSAVQNQCSIVQSTMIEHYDRALV